MASIVRYHISKMGKPAACRAKVGNCKLGDIEHFHSLEQARDSLENKYREENNIFSSTNGSGFNPKENEEKVSQLMRAYLHGEDDLNNLVSMVKKSIYTPQTMISLHGDFVQSKEYNEVIDKANQDNATDEDRELRDRYQNAALGLIHDISKLRRKDELGNSEINSFAKPTVNQIEPGTREWFKKQEDTLTAEEISIIYEYSFADRESVSPKKPVSPEITKAYAEIERVKSQGYSEEELDRLVEDYKNRPFNHPDRMKEIMSPLIMEDFRKRHIGKKVSTTTREFEHERQPENRTRFDGLINTGDNEDYDDNDEYYDQTHDGVVETFATNEQWGKRPPARYVVQSLYKTYIIGGEKAFLINREKLNKDNEYIVDIDSGVDPERPDDSMDIKEIVHEVNYQLLEWRYKRNNT